MQLELILFNPMCSIRSACAARGYLYPKTTYGSVMDSVKDKLSLGYEYLGLSPFAPLHFI